MIVNVLDEFIEGEDPLLQPAFDLLPVVGGNDAGNNVEGKDFLHTFVATVNIEGNAHFKEQGFGRLLAQGQIPRRQRLDFVHQQPGADAGLTAGVDQFIVKITRVVGCKYRYCIVSSMSAGISSKAGCQVSSRNGLSITRFSAKWQIR